MWASITVTKLPFQSRYDCWLYISSDLNEWQITKYTAYPIEGLLYSLAVGNGVFVLSDGEYNLFYSASGNNWKQAQISTRMQ